MKFNIGDQIRIGNLHCIVTAVNSYYVEYIAFDESRSGRLYPSYRGIELVKPYTKIEFERQLEEICNEKDEQ